MKAVLRYAIPLALIVALLVFFGSGLTAVSVDSFVLNGLSAVSPESFTFTGALQINNPSRLSVPVSQITYDVVLDRTGETIGSGSLDSFMLQSQAVESVDMRQEIFWTPTAQLAADVATQSEVFVTVTGTVEVSLLSVFPMRIPFSEQMDIKEYVLQFVRSPQDIAPVGVEDSVDTVVASDDEQEDSVLDSLLS